jgi:uncharacterized membrane protein
MTWWDTYLVSNIRTSNDFIESPSNRFAWTSIIMGVVGFLAAFMLTLERIHVAADPDAVLSCDLNLFVSCKSVMLTEQAKLFGFPNPLIGIAAFMAPIIVGFAILAGAKFKIWFWRFYLVGVSLGFVFAFWLFTQSTFEIHALCLYCMAAWIAIIPIFWKTFIWAAAEGAIEVPVKSIGFFVRAQDNTWVFTFGTEFLAALTIVIVFWNDWYRLFV